MSHKTPGGFGLRRLLSFPRFLTREGGAASAPSEGELLFELTGGNPENRLFGRFGEDWARSQLDRSGMLQGLARKGYPDPVLELSCADPDDQRIFLYAGERRRERLLLETRMQLCSFHPKQPIGPFTSDDAFRMLIIHWLVLSDPQAPFDFRRPRLPGQERPGLGLLAESLKLLRGIGRELLIDGILDIPDHFHTAKFYSRAMRFFDPVAEGTFQAMLRDLSGIPLALASEAVRDGAMVDARTGKPFEWQPSEQILPVHGPLRKYFRSDRYLAQSGQAAHRTRVTIDWDLYRRKIAAAGTPANYA
jgi:hypothetical protein